MTRTAIVTGAARGIGRAIARRLAHDGLRVVLTDVDLAAISSAAVASFLASPECSFVTGHVYCADGGFTISGMMDA